MTVATPTHREKAAMNGAPDFPDSTDGDDAMKVCHPERGEGPAFSGSAEIQIPPLRFAPVGMTKFRASLRSG
jgi:hypothetical protein